MITNERWSAGRAGHGDGFHLIEIPAFVGTLKGLDNCEELVEVTFQEGARIRKITRRKTIALSPKSQLVKLDGLDQTVTEGYQPAFGVNSRLRHIDAFHELH